MSFEPKQLLLKLGKEIQQVPTDSEIKHIISLLNTDKNTDKDTPTKAT